MIPYRKRDRTTLIILHSSHTVPGHRNLEAHLTVQGRVMGLLTCGYNAVILSGGKLVETRPHDTQGSHTPGFNAGSIGVCLEGGATEDGRRADTFDEDQMRTLRFLIGHYRGVYGPVPVKGHYELGRYGLRPHNCPPIDMAALRKELDVGQG